MERKTLFPILFLLSFLIFWIVLKFENPHDDKAIEKWTVYGADWCSATQLQKKYMSDKKIPYKYINCDDNRQLCSKLQIGKIPQLQKPDGTMISPGFKPV